ncbi:hypothetical protein OUZ56_000277 [Daphnia magna]|uniref:Uncharacterized protein n=1 Tax=Daphnia magna TaxID=35525 RepID=A0ABQ9ZZX0_9CRUS|nr:hypothetical protein OUZ56_000277 [Daphnia magna]
MRNSKKKKKKKKKKKSERAKEKNKRIKQAKKSEKIRRAEEERKKENRSNAKTNNKTRGTTWKSTTTSEGGNWTISIYIDPARDASVSHWYSKKGGQACNVMKVDRIELELAVFPYAAVVTLSLKRVYTFMQGVESLTSSNWPVGAIVAPTGGGSLIHRRIRRAERNSCSACARATAVGNSGNTPYTPVQATL